MRILGVDPGGTTGVVVWTDEASGGYGLLHVDELRTDAEQGSGPDAWREQEIWIALKVVQLAIDWKVDLIACEDFVLRDPRMGKSGWDSRRAAASPIRIQTMIHAFNFVHEDSGGQASAIPMVWQQASMAKTTMNDYRLRANGCWITGKPHARDACRHALTAYKRGRARAKNVGGAGTGADVTKIGAGTKKSGVVRKSVRKRS